MYTFMCVLMNHHHSLRHPQNVPFSKVVTKVTSVDNKDFITSFDQVDHHVPTQSAGTGDNEGLSLLRENDLTDHLDGFTKDGDEVGINVGGGRSAHGSENIFVELDRA